MREKSLLFSRDFRCIKKWLLPATAIFTIIYNIPKAIQIRQTMTFFISNVYPILILREIMPQGLYPYKEMQGWLLQSSTLRPLAIFTGSRRKRQFARDNCSNYLLLINQLGLQAIKAGKRKKKQAMQR